MFLLPSAGLVAQHAPRSTFGSAHGFGNVVFPGTGHAPGVSPSPFSISDPGFAGRLARTVGGGNPYPVNVNRGAAHGARAVYPYPVYVGAYGGYGGFGGYYEQPTPNVTVIAPPQMYSPAPAAPVIINQYFSNGAAPRQSTGSELGRLYEAPRNPVVESTGDAQRSFLVAFKDHAVYSALAYWVEGDTLHYVTPKGAHNQASLDLIDREFTDKLNRERNVEFRLSEPK
ncbi:MAG: hypothetical protein EXQ52_16935 [Bryobacterales bacterium]|nr:hypothetical protein [Bryobacterales bacterium]